MGSIREGSGCATAVLQAVANTLASWLGALLSAILLLRGLLPFAKFHSACTKGHTTAKQQQQQLAAAAAPTEAQQAAGDSGQDRPARLPLPSGYNPAVEQLRRSQFKRLEGRVYADYAGAAPYSERLLGEALQELSSSLHGNPHSEAGWAPENRSAAADAARLATLRWCNADPERYCCIFTAGATAALKLVGESFPWGPASAFAHLQDNHTSVLGIRQLAAQHGAACAAAAVEVAAAPDGEHGRANGHTNWCLNACSEAAAAGLAAAAAAARAAQQEGSGDSKSGGGRCVEETQHLFALPLESNFSGVRYDQRLVSAVQSGSVWWSADSPGSSNIGGSGSGSDSSDGSNSSSSSSGGGGGSSSSSTAQRLPAGRWRVLVDAAKGAATCPPDVSAFPADFVAVSYYKAFGWPTGLGALLVRRDALPCLRRRYFGGGTVEVALADEAFHRLRPGPAGWEDGTPSFLDLPALAAGFRFIQRLGGFPAVAEHAAAVAYSLAGQLAALRHWNGAPVCALYGAHAAQQAQQTQQAQQPLQQPHRAQQTQQQQQIKRAALPPGVCGQGPVVTFNLLRADGSFVGYREVERLASLCGIMLRTGCCCNPGACAAACGLSAADMRANWEAGHVCWDGRDIIARRPTGAVRASFGYASSLADVEAIVALVRRYFVEGQPAAAPAGAAPAAQQPAAAEPPAVQQAAVAEPPAAQQPAGRIGALWVYPIKSCRGFSPPTWPLGPTGLLYDRCWALVDPSGSALRLKQHLALASITATVDLERRLLVVRAAGEAEPLEVPLPEMSGAQAQPCACSNGSCTSSNCTGSGGGSGCSRGDGISSSGGGGDRDPFRGDDNSSSSSKEPFSVRVCSRTAWVRRSAAAIGGDAAAAAWFSRVLGTPCRLVQQAQQAQAQQSAASHSRRRRAGLVGPFASSGSGGSSSFANEGHLLLLGAASLADLARRAGSSEAAAVFAQRFRPNLVVEGCAAYAEDAWSGVSLVPEATRAASSSGATTAAASGSAVLSSDSNAGAAAADSSCSVHLSSAGPCARCDVVCINPLTGRRCGPEPLLSLAGYRRSRGRINFGQLMNVQQLDQLSSILQQLQPPQQQPHQQPKDAAATGQQGSRARMPGGAAAESALWSAWAAVGDSVFTAASERA